MNVKQGGLAFLDTHVFVYLFDTEAAAKQARAKALVEQALHRHDACISYQVVQETLNVVTRKLAIPVTPQDAPALISKVLMPLCRVLPSEALYLDAMQLRVRWQFSFYDALVVAAALQAGCTRLLSEDLQHGQQVGTLRIENPFIQ
jgi:predicted nucleic acid-binding protein